MKTIRTLVAAAAIAAGSHAFAGPVEVDFSSTTSQKGLGSFVGAAFYDSSAHTLSIDLTNTSAGRLTAFAFEVENGDSAKYERPGKHSPWKDERNRKDLINAKPYGVYEGGAAVNGRWGAAMNGIKAGGTGDFVFDITGANASNLTTADFFTGTKPELVASFAGFKHHKTDRAGGFGHVVTTTTTTTAIAPLIATLPAANLLVNPVDPIVIDQPIIVIKTPTNPGPTLGPSHGGTSAIPLPPAAPAGLSMLGLIGLIAYVRKLRGKFA